MTIRIKTAVLLIAAMATFQYACPLQPGDSECGDPKACDALANDIDPMVVAIAGGIDDQVGASFAKNFQQRHIAFRDVISLPLLVGDAWAATCGRPSTEACIDETRSISYSNCPLGSSQFVSNGTVTLTYSGTPNCGFSSVGDVVTRTLNVSRTTPDDGIVTTSSTFNADFRGNTIGGGTRLSITGTSTFSLEILGLRKTLTITSGSNSFTSYDLLMRTTSPLLITGGLSRGSRVINGGMLEVITEDNYFYTLVPQNLAYRVDCCYPVSGKLQFTETILAVRSGSIVFSGCGIATVVRDGDNRPYDVPLVSCE